MSKTLNSCNLVHDIKPGDIFYSSWGWEQTNIDFYQVISTTAKTVKIRKINQTRNYNASTMSGKTTAIPNDFVSNEALLKKPYLWNNGWRLNFQNGVGCKWDGDELSYSTYA